MAFISIGTAIPFQEGDLESLLKISYERERSLTVHGIKETIAALPMGMSKVRVELWQSDGKRMQRYLTGPSAGDKILEIDGAVYYISNRSRSVVVAHPPQPPRSAIDLMLRNYKVEKAGEDVISGRRCLILWIKPVHKGNPSKKLWIDAENSFPLRKEHYSPEGELESVSVFTTVEYNPEISDKLFRLPDGRRFVRRPGFKPVPSDQDPSPRLGFKPILLKNPPEGYVLAGMLINIAPPRPMLQVKYTDGLNQISIFERLKLRGRGMGMGWMHGGRRGRRMMWGRGGKECLMFERMGLQAGKAVVVPHPTLYISIVGDVSEEIMRRIVEENFGQE
jgi:outer membrane lipoprotein-sorting protein